MPEPKTDTKPAPSVAELKKLESQLAAGKEAAKTSILAQIDEHITQLGELGYHYQVAENGAPNGKARVCSLCHKEGHSKATCPTKK